MDSKFYNSGSSVFLCSWLLLGLVIWPRFGDPFVCISKSLRSLCNSFSSSGFGLCIYHLQNSQWITLPSQSCQVFYSFCANLLHSLILWLIVSFQSLHKFCPVGWGSRIHQVILCRGVRPCPNECPRYDTKQSDREVPVTLERWGMQITPLLQSLSGPLWVGVVAPNRVISMVVSWLTGCFFFAFKLHICAKLNCLK